MARPTKKEKLEREQLLKYFKRDSDIYINFERATNNLSNKQMIYIFVNNCSFRNTCNNLGGICATYNIDKKDGFDWEDEILYQELMEIDEVKHDYYASILAYSQSTLSKKDDKHYKAYQMIDNTVLIELFGDKRVKEFNNRGYSHYLHPLLRQLTDKEKEKLINHIDKNQFGTNTIIKREYTGRVPYFPIDKADLLVEIDFTKPYKEIEEYIKYLYSEYENNKIVDVFKYLNIKRNRPRLKEHDIYKTNGHKPFNVVLADKLFIYDAIKNGLNFSDIHKEINKYTKQFSNDKISKKTSTEYSKFMINFIDNEEFIKFRDGYY